MGTSQCSFSVKCYKAAVQVCCLQLNSLCQSLNPRAGTEGAGTGPVEGTGWLCQALWLFGPCPLLLLALHGSFSHLTSLTVGAGNQGPGFPNVGQASQAITGTAEIRNKERKTHGGALSRLCLRVTHLSTGGAREGGKERGYDIEKLVVSQPE